MTRPQLTNVDFFDHFSEKRRKLKDKLERYLSLTILHYAFLI